MFWWLKNLKKVLVWVILLLLILEMWFYCIIIQQQIHIKFCIWITEWQKNQKEEPPQTITEVDDIQHLKNNKSIGTDGISAELFKPTKLGLNNLSNYLNDEEMPEEWITSKCKKQELVLELPSNQPAQYSTKNPRITAERMKPHEFRVVGLYLYGFLLWKTIFD